MNEILSKLFEAIEFGKADKTSPYPPALKGLDGAKEYTISALDDGLHRRKSLKKH